MNRKWDGLISNYQYPTTLMFYMIFIKWTFRIMCEWITHKELVSFVSTPSLTIKLLIFSLGGRVFLGVKHLITPYWRRTSSNFLTIYLDYTRCSGQFYTPWLIFNSITTWILQVSWFLTLINNLHLSQFICSVLIYIFNTTLKILS